ncbi:unnamed protein product [Sphagnum balticum]
MLPWDFSIRRRESNYGGGTVKLEIDVEIAVLIDSLGGLLVMDRVINEELPTFFTLDAGKLDSKDEEMSFTIHLLMRKRKAIFKTEEVKRKMKAPLRRPNSRESEKAELIKYVEEGLREEGQADGYCIIEIRKNEEEVLIPNIDIIEEEKPNDEEKPNNEEEDN